MSGNNGSDSPGAKDPGFEDQDIAGIAGNAIQHLDGNAVAGPLWELFRFDIARYWLDVSGLSYLQIDREG